MCTSTTIRDVYVRTPGTQLLSFPSLLHSILFSFSPSLLTTFYDSSKERTACRASEYVDVSSGSDPNSSSLSSPCMQCIISLPPSLPSLAYFLIFIQFLLSSGIYFDKVRDGAVRDATIYLRAVSSLLLPHKQGTQFYLQLFSISSTSIFILLSLFIYKLFLF